MNWIDKAVGYVSPAAQLQRERARAALAIIRAYDGGKSTRRTEGWQSAV